MFQILRGTLLSRYKLLISFAHPYPVTVVLRNVVVPSASAPSMTWMAIVADTSLDSVRGSTACSR
jgi:hypothetical protein